MMTGEWPDPWRRVFALVAPRKRGRGGASLTLSVRHGIQLALLALIVIAALQLFLNQQAMTAAAFMLQRAEISYRQLDAYRQLSIDILEILEARDRAEATVARRLAEAQIQALERSVSFEVDLVRENGGEENNAAERRRIGRIRSIIQEVLAEDPSTAVAKRIYRDRLKPLLDEAARDEQRETTLVEAAMEERRRAMRWLGWLGILAQAAMALLVLAVVGRAVLGPLNRLVADIREFGRGRLAHRVAVRRHDEFGLLARHINRMAGHLDRRDRALVAMNSVLERTVAERTADLEARNAELQEIDASRRRFFVDVSHELRTPLTAIVGEADVTLRSRDVAVATCRESLTSILANATYLNRRIDDLMALARSSSGRLELDLQILDLNLVAVEAQAEIRSLAKVNQVRTHFEPLTVPVYVEGDRVRVRQCLMILLDNAVKFSPSFQSVDIRLSTNDSDAVLAVIDRGRGIPADELPVIFDRFYQTEVGRSRGGTGLGLAIARRIVAAHGGTIAAANAEGGGTAITITLPLEKGADP